MEQFVGATVSVKYKDVSGGETECTGVIEGVDSATDALTLSNGEQTFKNSAQRLFFHHLRQLNAR